MHGHARYRIAVPLLLLSLVAAAALAGRSDARGVRRARATAVVVVPRGRPVHVVFVGSSDYPSYTKSFRNALEMAIEAHPTVRGFPIQVDEYDPPCFGGSDPEAANVAAATTIAVDTRNVVVIGQVCSNGFRAALPVYERAGIATISGSATSADLPTYGPTVFNRTTVPDPAPESWYPLVQSLASDLEFQEDYRAEFGSSPMEFSDLYYDAASLLLRRLGQTSRVDASAASRSTGRRWRRPSGARAPTRA